MPNRLTDFQESMRNGFNEGQKRNIRRTAASLCQVFIVVSVLFVAGLSTGYWWRDNLAVERRAAMEEMHRKDLAARADEYGTSLKLLGRAMEILTARVETTAEKVSNIAETTEVAADTAKKAAITANRAVQSNAATGQNVPAVTREQVNRSVDRANSKVAR